MSGTRIEAKTDEGVVDGRLFLPAGQGPAPLVVYFMDAGGLRPATDAMGERLAAAGYAVLQPNLYWRFGDYAPFDTKTVFGDAEERKRLMGMLGSLKPAAVMEDTRALLDALTEQPRVRADRFGAVGYCVGGKMTFVAAATFGERCVAAASIHGGGLVSDASDSPHRGAGAIRARVYLGVADEDGSCTPEHQAALREALDGAGVRYQLELYEGARHGFAMTDFPVHDAAAEAKHWERVLALFADELAS